MKKIISFLLGIVGACTFAACDVSVLLGGGEGSESIALSSSETVESTESAEHTHNLTRKGEVQPTCAVPGNITYWSCECGAYFSDEDGTQEVTADDVIIAKKAHNLTYARGIEATCESTGRMEYWAWSVCKNYYADKECTQLISKTQVMLGKTAHDLTHHAKIPVNGMENGVIEHWTCGDCNGIFADAAGKNKITAEETILHSVMAIPDFVVEVPADRDPVVLQLTDTQLIDSTQARSPLSQSYKDHWAPDRLDDLCFNYLTEIINAANPDFIIITGDLIHGMYDDKGTSLLALIDYMESWNIPWSPVFGNHDNESKMGADWQCEQLEKAENCLFKQGELSGNCNYSVAIAQGGEITRVFYMLDTNAVTEASEESLANGQTVNDYCGAKPDQIMWCTEQIRLLKQYIPDLKISLACHIQPRIFEEAYATKYNFDLSENKPNINIDLYEGKEEGDFGYIGKQLIGPWDHDKSFFKTLKGLGLDSIFVGHVHYNTASVVYEGVRLHYGVKSGEHDRVNAIDAKTGEITEADRVKEGASPMIGGSIIVLSKTDGGLKDVHNYYCTDKNGVIRNGEIQWQLFASTNAKTLTMRKEYAVLNRQDD